VSVKVRKLLFEYRNFTLKVDKLDFESAKITSIVGPNGAGKTTLLKCIGGLLPIKKKSLFMDGKDIADLRVQERAQLIGYVPQEHSTTFNYSVLNFVLMGRSPYLSLFTTPSAEDVRIAEEALEFVGLRSYSHRSYSQLSSGERRLVLIARALAQKSTVFLLDEPITFLDPRHEMEIMELTLKLAQERGKTILITLHNLDMAIKYSDCMVFMKEGGIFAFGKTEEILDESLLEKVYDIKMKIIDYNGRKTILR